MDEKKIYSCKDQASPCLGHLFASTQASIAGKIITRTKFRRRNKMNNPSKMPDHLLIPKFFFSITKINMEDDQCNACKDKTFFMNTACPVQKRGNKKW